MSLFSSINRTEKRSERNRERESRTEIEKEREIERKRDPKRERDVCVRATGREHRKRELQAIRRR